MFYATNQLSQHSAVTLDPELVEGMPSAVNPLAAAASANQYRFSTKPIDDEVLSSTAKAFSSGLYYYGYRFYDPALGRWINRDPIGEEGGLNLYGFVYNNSIVYYDLLGLKIIKEEVLSGDNKCSDCNDVGNKVKVYERLDGSRTKEEKWVPGYAGFNQGMKIGIKQVVKP